MWLTESGEIEQPFDKVLRHWSRVVYDDDYCLAPIHHEEDEEDEDEDEDDGDDDELSEEEALLSDEEELLSKERKELSKEEEELSQNEGLESPPVDNRNPA
jgi:hypothetical protein